MILTQLQILRKLFKCIAKKLHSKKINCKALAHSRASGYFYVFFFLKRNNKAFISLKQHFEQRDLNCPGISQKHCEPKLIVKIIANNVLNDQLSSQ